MDQHVNPPNNTLCVEDLHDNEVVIVDSTDISDGEDGQQQGEEQGVGVVAGLPLPALDQCAPPVPAIQSVAVTNSDNVHFGNKTYFNGPVTIKQITFSKSGVENGGFVNTDEYETSSGKRFESTAKAKTRRKWLTIQTWHKWLLSIVCVSLTGVVCALVLTLYVKSSQDTNVTSTQSKSSHDSGPGSEEFLMAIFTHNYLIIVLMVVGSLLTFLFQFLINMSVAEVSEIVDTRQHTIVTTKGSEAPINIAPDHVLRIVSRNDWLAQPVEKPLDKLQQPVPWVIIAHTATETCNTQSECVLRVRIIQSFHVESRGWNDIGYNFLVGGDGSAYYGRGWDHMGAHTKGYNARSVGIALIGHFTEREPTQKQVRACLELIALGVRLGKIAPDYRLLAHRQLMSTASPGDAVYRLMEHWPHFVSNFTDVTELY